MVSIDQLAALCGVNKSTISRALSGAPGVSAEKRALIRKIAAEKGYYPNLNASCLRKQGGAGVAIISPVNSLEISWRRENALIESLSSRFNRVHLEKISPGDSPAEAIIRLAASNYDGFVVNGRIGPYPENFSRTLQHRQLPLCLVEDSLNGVDSVNIDRVEAVARIAKLMLGSRKNCIFFSGSADDCPRHLGLAAALAELPPEISGRAREYRISSGSFEEGFNLTCRLLAGNKNFDAVFAYSDAVAFGVLRALKKAGRSVPDEVAVAGLDDMPYAAYAETSLTTLAQPMEQIAGAATSLLEKRIAEFNHEAEKIILPLKLIERESFRS